MSKVAILIDGGFFLKRLASLKPDADLKSAETVAKLVDTLVRSHLDQHNKIVHNKNQYSLLYRTFFYDARPYLKRGHLPISRKSIDYSKTPEAIFRNDLINVLRRRSSLAVRLGEVRLERSWILKEGAQKALINREISVDELTDDDFAPGLRQKAVDMRIGLDIASLTLKRQVDTIILVTGDSDFVPAAKLARREGVRVILDPLWRDVSEDLFEHIDGVKSGFARPKARKKP
ncbi:MAG: NYN domain-containing protein [Alphaproteobacteria bacterium]|nr:NYN domain-containing protein [Alphaproteobacteria bacterium]